MILNHWQLAESPFRTPVAQRYFHEGQGQQEALARLHFLVDEHRLLGLLLGEPGTGKSLLLARLAGRLRRSGKLVAAGSLLGCDARELLWRLAAQFELNPRRGDDAFVLWRAVSDLLTQNRYQQRSTVMLLDDADQAASDALGTVVRLAHADPSPDARLTIVLASSYAGSGRLDSRLVELADLRIDLPTWSEEDTRALVTDSLMRAGRKEPIFTEEALVRLHELAGGVPRHVAQLAELALLAGAGSEQDEIDGSTVEAVYVELGVLDSIAPATAQVE